MAVLFAPYLQVFMYKILLSLLQMEWSQLSQPYITKEMLKSLHHLCGLSLDFLQHVQVSLVLESPELDTTLQVWHHQH